MQNSFVFVAVQCISRGGNVRPVSISLTKCMVTYKSLVLEAVYSHCVDREPIGEAVAETPGMLCTYTHFSKL